MHARSRCRSANPGAATAAPDHPISPGLIAASSWASRNAVATTDSWESRAPPGWPRCRLVSPLRTQLEQDVLVDHEEQPAAPWRPQCRALHPQSTHPFPSSSTGQPSPARHAGKAPPRASPLPALNRSRCPVRVNLCQGLAERPPRRSARCGNWAPGTATCSRARVWQPPAHALCAQPAGHSHPPHLRHRSGPRSREEFVEADNWVSNCSLRDASSASERNLRVRPPPPALRHRLVVARARSTRVGWINMVSVSMAKTATAICHGRRGSRGSSCDVSLMVRLHWDSATYAIW